MKLLLAYVMLCFLVGVLTRNSRPKLATWLPFVGAIALALGYYAFGRT